MISYINPADAGSVQKAVEYLATANKITIDVVASNRNAKLVDVKALHIHTADKVVTVPFFPSVPTSSPIIKALTRGFVPDAKASTAEVWVMVKEATN